MKNIEKIKENVALALKKNFPQTSQSISADNLVLIHEGRFANAAVLRYKDDSLDLTVKDFSGSPFWIRRVFGVFSTRTEYTAKKALALATGDHGVLQRLSPWSIAFDYVRGDTLNKVPRNVPADYFIKMEQIVSKLHECGFVHLDLRNLGNMILGDDGKPYIIDFQSCLSTKHMPRFIRKYLEKVDFSGIYKAWERKCPQALAEGRKSVLSYVNAIRKFWVFKGYPLEHFLEKRKMKH